MGRITGTSLGVRIFFWGGGLFLAVILPSITYLPASVKVFTILLALQ